MDSGGRCKICFAEADLTSHWWSVANLAVLIRVRSTNHQQLPDRGDLRGEAHK